jgi:NhaP-type Na+/H+ or K+/H+ antiporter
METFVNGVIGIIAMVVAGFVVMNWGMKDKNGKISQGKENLGKGCANFFFFIIVGGIVSVVMLKECAGKF